MFVLYVVVATVVGLYVVLTYSPFWSDAERYLYTRSQKTTAQHPEASPPGLDASSAAPRE